GLAAEAGELEEATARAARAAALATELGSDPFLSVQAFLQQSHLEAARGSAAAAAAHLEKAERWLAQLPPHHPFRIQADATRAGLAWMQGKAEWAVSLAPEAVRRIEQAGGERSPWLPGALRFLAEQLAQAGRRDEAEAAYERAFDVQQRLRGPEHADLAVTLRGLARLY